MDLPSSNDESRNEAFIKAAQYIVRLTDQQDVCEHLARLMTTFYGAAWVAFACREPSGEIMVHHSTLPDPLFREKLRTGKSGGVISDVLESGFLTTEILALPESSRTAFIPIPTGSQTKHIMLVGHGDDSPLGNGLLNTYLAVASLAGAKIESIRDEQELRRHRDHLEELVRERTATLEELNRELESFSYSISHDLRAPLRAIDGYSRMILRTQGTRFDAETQRQFNIIRDNTRMMGQLIEDLLAFSRMGRAPLSVEMLDLKALAAALWEEVQFLHPDRRMTFKIGHLPPGRGDRTLIRQVLSNLLHNAVKFTRSRKEALIEVGGYDKDREQVYYVRDNGVGFDMAYYDKLFGVFQRLHSAEDYEGTGVGLALVQRIIHRHGGRVWAEGEVDRGACFYFTLKI
ncbi:MAG: ATP-binding protein [Deltaproteobacteria bacterium]|nr:ATP-binding protein [Deltaproteobacteria bacterium]